MAGRGYLPLLVLISRGDCQGLRLTSGHTQQEARASVFTPGADLCDWQVHRCLKMAVEEQEAKGHGV